MKKYMISFLMFAIFIGSANAMDLSFDDAVQKIMTESNDLKKSDANVKQAQAQLDAVNSNRWFKVDASATYMNLVNVQDPSKPAGVELPPQLGGILASMGQSGNFIELPDNILMAGATVTQPIYTFGKIGNAVDAVHSAIKMSESGREIARREVRYAAAQLYWTAKMTDGNVVIAQKSLDDANAAKKKLTAAGRASRGNLVKIQADIATKEINLSDAEFNRDTAHRMLKIMAGIDVNEKLNLTTDIPGKFETLGSVEISDNPEWDMLNQQVRMYESNASSKRADGYPTLAATASYNMFQMGNDFDAMRNSHAAQSAYWGLSLKVPIFSGGLNRANATIETMNAEAARQDLDKSKKMKTEEFETAVKKYEHLRSNLENLENARDLAAKAYSFSRDRFAAGQTSAVELADVSSSLYQLDMALLNAKYNLLMTVETINKLK